MAKSTPGERAKRAARRAPTRRNNPEKTQAEILEVASQHFAKLGLSGARVDEIAERTSTSKRMIYYYFGSKKGLYLAALERAYFGMRQIEQKIDVRHMEPTQALETLVAHSFDYQYQHPDFARLVAIENVHQAKYIRQIPGIRELNAPALAQLQEVLERGSQSGAFRDAISAVDVHWMISAFAVFNVTNEATFSFLFARDSRSPEGHAARRQVVVDAVLRWCRA